jgi:hypothetical protein
MSAGTKIKAREPQFRIDQRRDHARGIETRRFRWRWPVVGAGGDPSSGNAKIGLKYELFYQIGLMAPSSTGTDILLPQQGSSHHRIHRSSTWPGLPNSFSTRPVTDRHCPT